MENTKGGELMKKIFTVVDEAAASGWTDEDFRKDTTYASMYRNQNMPLFVQPSTYIVSLGILMAALIVLRTRMSPFSGTRRTKEKANAISVMIVYVRAKRLCASVFRHRTQKNGTPKDSVRSI